MKREFSKRLGMIVLLAWLIQLPPVFMTHPRFESIADQLSEFHGELTEKWNEKHKLSEFYPSGVPIRNKMVLEFRWKWVGGVGMIIFGLVSAVLAIVNARPWRFVLILSSLLYMYVWIFSGFLGFVSPISAMRMKWAIAMDFGLRYEFFARDIILPVVCMIVFISFASEGLNNIGRKGPR